MTWAGESRSGSSGRAPSLRLVARQGLFKRRVTRFLREPVSAGRAARVVVTATTIVVIAGGLLMWLLDHREYPSVGRGMWWALQTVTTVGYGDVTPRETAGRIVAAFVMLEGIAFLAIVTAAITSTFIERARRETDTRMGKFEQTDREKTEARFDELDRKLDRLEATLRESRGP